MFGRRERRCWLRPPKISPLIQSWSLSVRGPLSPAVYDHVNSTSDPLVGTKKLGPSRLGHSPFFFSSPCKPSSLNKSLFEAHTQRRCPQRLPSTIALGESPRTSLRSRRHAETRRHKGTAADLGFRPGPPLVPRPALPLHPHALKPRFSPYGPLLPLLSGRLMDEDMSPRWSDVGVGDHRRGRGRCDAGWWVDAAVLAGAVSGAEDLLSRLIGMRLLGVLAGLLDGAYSWDEEGLTSHHCCRCWSSSSLLFFHTLDFIGSLWGLLSDGDAAKVHMMKT